MTIPKYIVFQVDIMRKGTSVELTNITDEVESVILKADRKTEPNSSEFPNNCKTKLPNEDCGFNGCDTFGCPSNYCRGIEDEPQFATDTNVGHKDELTGYNLSPVEDEPQTCSVNGRPYTDCCNCEYFKCAADGKE